MLIAGFYRCIFQILMCVNVLPYLLGKYYQLLNYYKHNSNFYS
jgi:hypothetical protein